MFREIPNLKQHPGEPPRRWFSDTTMDWDLILWEHEHAIFSFQLYYKSADLQEEHALTWKEGYGFTHDNVDNGENRPGKHKASPVLTPDGFFDRQHIAERFWNASQGIESYIADFIYQKLLTYPEPS
jgi:hypothetical protein